MKSLSEKYLHAMRTGGPTLLAIIVIADEMDCNFVKSTSKIVANPDLALSAIMNATMDMDMKIYNSMLDGTFLSAHVLPIPNLT